MNVLLNVAAFKLAWLSSIFGGANELPMLGPLAVLVAVSLHLWLAAEPQRELALVAITGAIGLVWDSVMVSAGWMTYSSGTFITGLAPYWILGMWMLFATTLNVTFRWLQSRTVLAVILGAVFGPLSYMAGAAAGAVELNNPTAVYTALSLSWALLMPGLLMLARQLDGVQPVAVQSPA
jgi:hypothetical protein